MGKSKLELQWMLERTHNHLDDDELVSILEKNGFTSILLRTGSAQPDPWVIASHYATKFKQIKFIIAVNPAMMSPAYCAIKVSTFQKLFGDRISLNIVSGPSRDEQQVYNDNLSIKYRYKRSKEFAQVVKELTKNGIIENYRGNFYTFDKISIPNLHEVEIVFAGSSDDTIDIANQEGTTHYHSMETPELYKRFRNLIKINSAIKSTIIIEDSYDEAKSYAESLISGITDNDIIELKKDVGVHESQNQKRQSSLHNYSKENLFIHKNIWTGYGLLRGGGITCMLGSPEDVANLISEYYNLGLNKLLIAGTPEIYYAKQFIDKVIPLLKQDNVI